MHTFKHLFPLAITTHLIMFSVLLQVDADFRRKTHEFWYLKFFLLRLLHPGVQHAVIRFSNPTDNINNPAYAREILKDDWTLRLYPILRNHLIRVSGHPERNNS